MRCCVEASITRDNAEHNKLAWMMYHGAMLSRAQKKPPPLKAFLAGDKKTMKGIDEAAIMIRLKEYQRRRDDGCDN